MEESTILYCKVNSYVYNKYMEGSKITWNESKLKELQALADKVSKIIERSEKAEIQEEYELRYIKK